MGSMNHAIRVASLVALTVPVVACNESELGTLPPSHSETHYQGAENVPVDVLFVVDNSGSMAQEQAKLTQDFQAFITHFTSLGLDFHIGIITTDIANPAESGKLQGSPHILTSSTPEIERYFLQNATTGTDGSGAESGLEAIRLALSEPNLSGANAGFLRPNAILAVIVVSDEEDWSDGDTNEPAIADAPAISMYADLLLALKGGDPSKVTFPVIVGDVPSGCTSPDADAEAGVRYHELATALNGSKSSICSENFAEVLDTIGSDLAGLVTAFPLAYTPDPVTITVEVDGVLMVRSEETGWYWDSLVGGVAFAASAVPAACSVIEISYAVTDYGGPIETGNAEAPPEQCPMIVPPVQAGNSLNGGYFACTVGAFDATPGATALLFALASLSLVVMRRRA